MKLVMIICLLVTIIIVFILSFKIQSQSEPYEYNNDSPKLIHLIYIPWDKNQKLKDDYLDFDKKPYEELKRNNPEYNIKLWTGEVVFLHPLRINFHDRTWFLDCVQREDIQIFPPKCSSFSTS